MKFESGKNKFGVCILVWNIDSLGGMERQAWRLARELAKKGIKVTIISNIFVEKFNLKDFIWQKSIKDKVNVYRIPLKQWRYLTSIVFYIISLCLMIKWRKKFDLIYGVQLYSYGAIASLAGKLLNKPVVVKIACGGYCGDISMFSKLSLGWLVKIFAKWADVYVSLGKQIDKELGGTGFNKGEIAHIPNGVDTSVFYPVRSIEEKTELRRRLSLPNKKIVVFIGRLDPQKRADLLIEIFNEVHKIYN
ncbi:MAG: glycosyltransferase, partial [Candidatus Helarchaeota archaeon]|nr:glycosyltransferase [Candidatus Helarchaeota archaeon]